MSAIDFLLSKGKKVKVYDDDKTKLFDLRAKNLLINCVVESKLNKTTLLGVECVVLSPTVRIDKRIKKIITALGIKIMSEFSLASFFNPAPLYCVTGTNGKTTTVNMLQAMLSSCGQAYLVGNVGTPFTSVVSKINSGDSVVAEVSNFQLENMDGVIANAVAITNIAPDHLDMYSSFTEYIKAKHNIMSVVQSKKVFLNYDDEILREWGDGRSEYFSLKPLPNDKNGIFVNNGEIYQQQNGVYEKLMDLPPLKSRHNVANFLCAMSLALYAGVSVEQISNATRSFVLPRHRQEIVKIKDGITFVNDSKATNIHAVKSALENFKESRIILLLGGSDKGEDYAAFLSKIPSNVKCVVTFGALHKKLSAILKREKKAYHDCGDVFEAVNTSINIAKTGDVVLFSPGGASFDEFTSYSERGDYFCELVNEI